MNPYKAPKYVPMYFIYRNATYLSKYFYDSNKLIMRKFRDGKMIIIGYKHQKIFSKKINAIANESL